MKKMKKMLSISTLGLLLTVSAVTCASATSVNFVNNEVPKTQGYSHLLGANTSTNTAYGDVKVTAMSGVNAVTFSAASVASGVYGTGKVIETKDLNIAKPVEYIEQYQSGTAMVARVRNHSWSLSRGFVSGTFNYK